MTLQTQAIEIHGKIFATTRPTDEDGCVILKIERAFVKMAIA
ncbi:MAG: hypothetical protein ACRC11_15795 [Xenococcaceae cyanobacterium]